MNRRRFLKLAAGTGPLIAGCTSQTSQQTETDVHTSTSTFTASSSDTPTNTRESTPTPRENPGTIFVDDEIGSSNASGTHDDPLALIQTAMELAELGETVYVMLASTERLCFHVSAVNRMRPLR